MKLGSGPVIPEGAAIRAHLKFAQRIDQFHDDAQVLGSTYRRHRPAIIRLDREVLRPEVFEGLVGLTEGSTVVIALSIQGSAAAEYVEIWIESLHDAAAALRHVVARVEMGVPIGLVQGLHQALSSSRQQVNGRVIALATAELRELTERFIAEVRQTDATLSAATALPTRTAASSLVVSPALWAALYNRVETELADRATK